MTDTTTQRRADIADATADAIGKLLHDARQTTDPLKLLDIKANIAKYDPTESLDSLLVLSDFVINTKPADITKATAARDRALNAVDAKKAEIEKAVAKLNAELVEAVDLYQAATRDHAIAAVNHNRWQALKTGTPAQGYGEYSRPAIRAWARHAKLI